MDTGEAGAAGRHMANLAANLNDPAAIIYVRDSEGRYVWVSDSYGDLLPFTREQVIGKTNRDLYGDAARNWEVADSFARITSDYVTTAEDLYDTGRKRWRKFISTKMIVKFHGAPYLVGISVEVKGPQAAEYERKLGALRAYLLARMSLADEP